MKRKTIMKQLFQSLTWIFVVVLILITTTPVFGAKNVKTVLILNSYHHGLSWTEGESNGAVDVLKKSGQNLDIHVEYMDWKNYPSSENLRFLINYFSYKYKNLKFDIIIASDDAALQFALEHRQKLFSNAPVVFCGVNKIGAETLTKGYTNVSGVLEEMDPAGTIRLAMKVKPNVKKVYILYDNTESGISTGEITKKAIQKVNPNLICVGMNNLTHEQVSATLKNAESDSMILLTTYYVDSTGASIDFDAVCRDISAISKVPVFHLFDFGLGNGAIGGSVVSSRLQGEKAGKIALQVLNGQDINQIPISNELTVQQILDYNQLTRFHISLNNLDKNINIIHKPFSFYETYKKEVIAVILGFVLLLGWLITSLISVWKLRLAKDKLKCNNDELTALYQQLSASEEQIKQQYNELKESQENLKTSEERFRLASEGSNDMIWDQDLINNIYFSSDQLQRFFDEEDVFVSDQEWEKLVHPDDLTHMEQSRREHLEGKTDIYKCEYRVRTKDGYRWFYAKGKALFDSSGKPIRFAGSLTDIHDRKENELKLQESYQQLEATYEELSATEEELQEQYNQLEAKQQQLTISEERFRHLAYYDPLTGLPNRLYLKEKLVSEIENRVVNRMAVYFIDTDNFKYINDSLGHSEGDQLLILIGERLRGIVGNRGEIVRFGGDEFIIFIKNPPDQMVKNIAEELLQGFNEPFYIKHSRVPISISVGISIYPDHGFCVDDLLKNADIAMYRAKETGKGKHVLFDENMMLQLADKIDIDMYLRSALEREEFILYYQPQIDLHTGNVTGLEALIRWVNPKLGMVMPNRFIKIAEDNQVIIPLGTWILRKAIHFIKNLHIRGYENCNVSVNVSVIQLLQTNFTDTVIEILREVNLEPQYLELEITESILMESYEAIKEKLEILRNQGIKIALDDFGKGYSSLSHLKQLPIDTLKIDKSFIDNLSEQEGRITGAIVLLGHDMGLRIVAEGVETQEQLDYLKLHNCDSVQGYFFSKPIEESKIDQFLDSKI